MLFAIGHDPAITIKQWESTGVKSRPVHFNDLEHLRFLTV
jgi:hypothetical protein